MSWPLALMVSIAMLVIGTTAVLDRDVAAVSGAIVTLLIALGLAELREIKTNTNGNNNQLLEQNREQNNLLQEQNKALMAEIAQYRRDALNITNRALESAPLVAPQSPPDVPVPSAPPAVR